jgi:hypothetical protein
MNVDVRLTEEQKNAEPDFDKTLARFQRQYDDLAQDVREKFRLCLHEGGHAMYFRRFGVDVNFHGPHVEAHKDGISFALGAVSPEWSVACAWQHAAVSMAGFTVVERLTGVPNEESIIQNDLRMLGRKLKKFPRLPHEPEDHLKRVERATEIAEFAILSDMEEPQFLLDLERATRDYERAVFHTDETWSWAEREYRFDLPGERYAVGNNCLGFLWLLIDNGELRLIVNGGKDCSPSDKVHGRVHGYSPELFACNAGEKRAADAVRRWNERVYAGSSLLPGAVTSPPE